MKTNFFTTAFLCFFLLQLNPLSAQDENSLFFDGSNQYVEIAGDPLNTIGTGDFTMEAWVKGDEAEQSAHPMVLSNRGESSFGGGVFISFHNLWGGSQYKMLNFQIDANNYIFIDNGTFNASILDNTCHHVAITRSGNKLSFFVDGNLIGEKNPSNIGTIANDHPLWIGQDRANNNTFNGNISQIRIWDIARTENEIKSLMGFNIAEDTPGLIAYWEMTDGTGQTLADKTGTYNGQLGEMDAADSFDPAWSDEGCEVETLVGVNDLDPSTISLFPNPTADLVTITTTNQTPLHIKVIDITGKVLFSEKNISASTTLDLSNFASGIYQVQMTSDGQSLTKKLVKY